VQIDLYNSGSIYTTKGKKRVFNAFESGINESLERLEGRG
jgi:hypothetical protein